MITTSRTNLRQCFSLLCELTPRSQIRSEEEQEPYSSNTPDCDPCSDTTAGTHTDVLEHWSRPERRSGGKSAPSKVVCGE